MERKRWDDKQKEIKQTRKIFGDISFLLQKNAYRVAIKQNFWTEGQDTETQREDAEKGKRVSVYSAPGIKLQIICHACGTLTCHINVSKIQFIAIS